MTTVAVSKSAMCSDSLCIDQGSRSYVQKIFAVDGALIGFAGEVSQGLMFVEWYVSGGKDHYPFDKNFEAVVLYEDGSIYSYDSGLMPIKMEQQYYAIGSGKQAATAAMMMGMSPSEAVEIAIKIDACTGGNIQRLHVSQIKAKPKKKKRKKKK